MENKERTEKKLSLKKLLKELGGVDRTKEREGQSVITIFPFSKGIKPKTSDNTEKDSDEKESTE